MAENHSEQLSSRMTIRIEPGVLEYSKDAPSTAVKDAFDDAVEHIDDLRLYSFNLRDEITLAIFGSNMIEGVGCNFTLTDQLCRGLSSYRKPSDKPPWSPEYCQQLKAQIEPDLEDKQDIQQRREVIGHAIAFMFILDAVVRNNKPFSEDIIKDTHAILCSDIPITTRDGAVIPNNTYAGHYRTCHVHAGNTNFVTPNQVPVAMTRFIAELNNYLTQAEGNHEIDPFYIAAHACGEFVNIHPFLDGNGRTCRLILNAILLKYARVICPFGALESERKEYIEIAKRRSENEQGNGELASFVLGKCLVTLKGICERIADAVVSNQANDTR